jgi:two-component system, OmpR family, phosphate regulon sensor histidine kinase PhoR
LKLTLQWRWFGALAALWLALLGVIYLSLDMTMPSYLVSQIRTDLERDARFAQQCVLDQLAGGHPSTAAINAVAHALGRSTGLRVSVMAADGAMLGESEKPESEIGQIENHLERPEVQEALSVPEGVGSARRHSKTIGVDLLYVAVAVRLPDAAADSKPLGFVRVALPLQRIEQTTGHVHRIVTLATLLVGLVAIPPLFWMARRVTVPIQQMRAMAGSVARADFSKQVTARPAGELGELVTSLNDMAAQLRARLHELNDEKAGLSAILSSMTEGVLAMDAAGKIRLANDALRQQLDIGEEAIGKSALEVFRNVALQDIIAEAVQTGRVAGRELAFLNPVERMFEVNAARLQSRDGGSAGLVVLLHDITRLKRLENLRKEFVANVSHELRTPLSIIKGYVETLLDPQPPDAGTARQFLQTIQRHSQRLEMLIGDLLSISALESQQTRVQLDSVSLRDVAATAAEELGRQARVKNTAIVVEIPGDFPAVRADAQRLHQVFFNLMDNAVKYVQPGGRISISAKLTDGEIEIQVADNGPGIAAEHLPRIFERFYRVDKARSRELGGTGLGLSIVKHIVQAHGGRVWAESEVGRGSVFYFTLPWQPPGAVA